MTTNQLRMTHFAARPPRRMLASVAALPLLLVSAAAAGVIAVSHPEWYRGALAIALTVNLIIVAMKWPRAAAVATLLLLPFLALVRRLLIADAGFVSNDPLLLVGPVVALFVLYRIYVVERQRSDDRLFKLVAALLVVAVVQVFNPLAIGGVIAAAGGLLFVGVPLLWFFVGRELGDRASVAVLLYGTIVVGCVVAVYGLLQTQYGTITSWDQAWVDVNGYSALQVSDSETGSVLRPFSTFSSNQEYAAFLSIAFTFAVALLLRRRPVVVLALPLLVLALFLAGGRGSLVLSAIAGIVLLALMTRNWLAGLLVVFLGVVLAYGVASTFGAQIDRAAGIGGDAVVERNVTGILKPLDPGKSTVIAHWDSILDGFVEGFKNPAGQGTAATNIATNLTDTANKDKENDLSNTFVGLGIVGGLLYVAIIVLLFRTVFRRYVRHRDALSLAVAGLLVVTFGQWLNGGQYAVAPLLWFLAGWATRPDSDDDQAGGEAALSPAGAGAPAGVR